MNLPDETIFAERCPPRKQPGDRFVIVYHGTLARRLGLDVAVRAVAELSRSIPDLEFRIIGAGEERQRLVELASELQLDDVVRFSDGYVPVTQIPALISDADIGVIPLRILSGTDIMLPTKLLEYVSMGIPCVVPRTGTVGRYFDDDMVEFFAAEDVGALASAIRRLYEDPVRREKLAREATARFGRAHRWSTHKQVYLDLVSSLLKSRH
jgi:glycosyltransferase involved in cell wall biosynthesis